MTTFRMLALLSLLFFAGKNSIAQTFKVYKDAANHFEISIPTSWLVTQTDPRLKFIAIRPQDKQGNPYPENINLNFIDAPDGNLNAAYAMSIESNSALPGFLSVTKKGAAANGHYKWYINSHKDLQTNTVLQTIVFVYYDKEKAVLLTCTAPFGEFDRYYPVFLKIADSLKL
jgi:hypothetical protein